MLKNRHVHIPALLRTRIMPDDPTPKTPKPNKKPPSAEELLDSAKRLKSQALYVGTTRLIQESRHLRETHERAQKEAEKIRKLVSRKKPKTGPE